MDEHTTDQLPGDKPLWPLVNGAKESVFYMGVSLWKLIQNSQLIALHLKCSSVNSFYHLPSSTRFGKKFSISQHVIPENVEKTRQLWRAWKWHIMGDTEEGNLAKPRQMKNVIWQSLGLDFVSINAYIPAKYSALFKIYNQFHLLTTEKNLELGKATAIEKEYWHFLWPDSVNINVYTNFGQNISSRGRTVSLLHKLTSAKPWQMKYGFWQSLGLDLINIHVYTHLWSFMKLPHTVHELWLISITDHRQMDG